MSTTFGIPDPGRAPRLEQQLAASDGALQLFKFEHQPIRVVLIDGAPHFVARDVCNAIDLPNMSMALTRLDDDEKGVSAIDTPGGAQQMAVITESGLYSLVLRSDKREAAKFRRWVTHKVLPEIRRTGSYSHLPAAPVQLPSKKELAQWVVEAEERAERAEAERDALKPSAHRAMKYALLLLASGTGAYAVASWITGFLTDAGIFGAICAAALIWWDFLSYRERCERRAYIEQVWRRRIRQAAQADDFAQWEAEARR